MDIEIDGILFRHCAPKPEAHFAPFWWPDLPDNGGLMAFCVGEILSWSVDNDRMATDTIRNKGDKEDGYRGQTSKSQGQ